MSNMEDSRVGDFLAEIFGVSEDWGLKKCMLYAFGMGLAYLIVSLLVTGFFYFSYFTSPPVSETVVTIWTRVLMGVFLVFGGIYVSCMVKASDKYIGKMAFVYLLFIAPMIWLVLYMLNGVVDTGF